MHDPLTDASVVDLVDEHRRITTSTRTSGHRHGESRAMQLLVELDNRGHQALAEALADERHLVTAPVRDAGHDTIGSWTVRARELRRCQDKVRALRAALVTVGAGT